MAKTETLSWRPPPSVRDKLAGGTWLLTGATGFLGEALRRRAARQQGLQLRRQRRRLPPLPPQRVPPIRRPPAWAAPAFALCLQPQTRWA